MIHDTILPSEEALRRKTTIQSFKARADKKRSASDTFADFLTSAFGTVIFLIINALFFLFWILWNTGTIPHLPILDPFPFGFLTMVVSLEAIFLAIIVLISQNRQARVAELREEIDLYINTYAEREITKLIYLQKLLLEKNGVDLSNDRELQHMLKALESDKIEKELGNQL